MYTFLTNPLTDLFIDELRKFWQYHPKYPDLVNNIQGKYSFDERPQKGIVVKPSGGSNVRLTWDNFQGTKVSYVGQARVPGFPGVSLEWVRENSNAIKANGGVFPSLPGFYYITITSSDLDARGVPTGTHEFVVNPRIRVLDEGVEMVNTTTGFLDNLYLEDSLRVFEMPSNRELVEGVDFIANSETGEITLTEELPSGLYLSADYTYLESERGPFSIQEDRAHYEAIPGVVLGFGRRITPGDQLAVQVCERREPVAEEFGGRWDISLDIEMWARDVDTQREIHDLTATFVAVSLRSHLSSRGVEIKDVSLGGEIEEQYDENGDDYFYGANISLSLQTDWQIYVPIVARIKDVQPLPLSQIAELASLSDEDVVAVESNLKSITDLQSTSFRDPFFSNLRQRFPVIR